MCEYITDIDTIFDTNTNTDKETNSLFNHESWLYIGTYSSASNKISEYLDIDLYPSSNNENQYVYYVDKDIQCKTVLKNIIKLSKNEVFYIESIVFDDNSKICVIDSIIEITLLFDNETNRVQEIYFLHKNEMADAQTCFNELSDLLKKIVC